jgi:hypothetical protein
LSSRFSNLSSFTSISLHSAICFAPPLYLLLPRFRPCHREDYKLFVIIVVFKNAESRRANHANQKSKEDNTEGRRADHIKQQSKEKNALKSHRESFNDQAN